MKDLILFMIKFSLILTILSEFIFESTVIFLNAMHLCTISNFYVDFICIPLVCIATIIGILIGELTFKVFSNEYGQ